MENKLILKKAVIATAIATPIFGAFVGLIEGTFFYSKGDEASGFILAYILMPIELLGYGQPDVYAHTFLLLTLNAALYSVPFAAFIYFHSHPIVG